MKGTPIYSNFLAPLKSAQMQGARESPTEAVFYRGSRFADFLPRTPSVAESDGQSPIRFLSMGFSGESRIFPESSEDPALPVRANRRQRRRWVVFRGALKKLFLVLFLCSLIGCGRDQLNLEEGSPDESGAPTTDDRSTTEEPVAALDLALLSSPSSGLSLGGSGPVQFVVNVTFSNQSRKEGVTYRLLDPESKKLTQVLWESSNKEVSHLSERGLLTPVSPGETLVRATLRGKTATAYLLIQGRTTEALGSAASGNLNVDVQLNIDPEDYGISAAPGAGVSVPSGSDNNACDLLTSDLDPFADRVVEYRMGPGGGFQQELLPDIVLGPPHAHPTSPLNGSFDVLSLGKEGEIVLEFTDYTICDGEGDDFIVFENPWQYNPDAKYGSYTEPATVSVSEDGVHFVDFPCHLDLRNYPGCAGVRVVLANPDINDIDPTDPEKAGGDPFDLKEIGLTSARFVRIRDQGKTFGPAGGGMRGFDLDAVAVVNGKVSQ